MMPGLGQCDFVIRSCRVDSRVNVGGGFSMPQEDDPLWTGFKGVFMGKQDDLVGDVFDDAGTKFEEKGKENEDARKNKQI